MNPAPACWAHTTAELAIGVNLHVWNGHCEIGNSGSIARAGCIGLRL